MSSDLFGVRLKVEWSNGGGALESQDVQTLPFETIDFRKIIQVQHFFWFS